MCSCSQQFPATKFSIIFHFEMLMVAIALAFKLKFILLSTFCMLYAVLYNIIELFWKK